MNRLFFSILISVLFFHNGVFSVEPWEFFSVHGFDHLDNLDKQAESASLCSISVLYATGVGVCQYMGIPEAERWESIKEDTRKYVTYAKSLGISVVLGYLCSTSIVNLETFDKHWTEDFRKQFTTSPNDWLQQDENGKVLPSWYGGDYNPACMNHPDWREYEKFMVKTQLELGMDGIFFDNPTVHEKGCFCPYCMEKFLDYLRLFGEEVTDTSIEHLREIAREKKDLFKKFRCAIARDFFAEIREYARTIKPGAVITANNSLNAPEVLFSQCHQYAYNIKEMSKSQDFVVIEDMRSTPRWTSDGNIYEMGPVYSLLNAIIGGKPLVAVTIADGDYHTPPNLTNLSIFESFAHHTNYMLWSTWQESYREKMVQTIRPFVLWLRKNAPLVEKSTPRMDVLLYFPFEQWIYNKECKELAVARELRKANIQFAVVAEDNFNKEFKNAKIVIATSKNFIPPTQNQTIEGLCKNSDKNFIEAKNSSFIPELEKHLTQLSLKLNSANPVRGIVRDENNSTILLLYNLKIEKISSYEDKIHHAEDITVSVRVPATKISTVVLSTPEKESSPIEYQIKELDSNNCYVNLRIPELSTSALVKIIY